MRINLPISSYQLRSAPASSSRLVNCYPEQLPPGAKSLAALVRAPGVVAWATVGSGPIKAMHPAYINFASGALTRLYVVSGSELYSVDTAGTSTLLGNIGTPNRIDVDSNRANLVVVNEPRAWYYDGTYKTGTHTAAGSDTVMTDSAADFEVDALIGYRIFNTTDGSDGIITDNDATSVTVSAPNDATVGGLGRGSDNSWDTSDAYTIKGFTEILDEDFVNRGAGDVEFLDNWLLFREPNSGRIFGADLDSASSFDALNYVNSDSQPDNLLGMVEQHRQLYAFGETTGEIFQNTGTGGFPFERNINGTFGEGCLNADTVRALDNSVFWVADDYTVRRLDGNTPLRISTHAIEQKLAATTVLGASTYDQEGHFWYVLDTLAGTYCFDVVTGEWSERQTYGKVNWSPRQFTQFAGKELCGDGDSNKIGYLSNTTYTEWGSTQRMEWQYQTVYADGQKAFHDRLEIVLETGVGATTGQGSAPKIMLQFSDDGGISWHSLPDREFGARGVTLSRAVWHNLGQSRQRVYRAAVSDPVPVTVTDTILEVKGGRL